MTQAQKIMFAAALSLATLGVGTMGAWAAGPANADAGANVQGAANVQPAPAPATQPVYKFDIAAMPDPHAVPVLASVLSEPSLRIYPMGQLNGLDGWFTVNDKKEVQIFYTTADGRGILVGALFNDKGENVTAEQMVALRDREPAVRDLFKQAAQNIANQYQTMTGPPGAKPAINSASPGENLLKELLLANWVTIGNPKAPVIYMVVDPRCPHCKNAWAGFADAVKDGKAQLRLIPVDILGGDSRRLAADLIAAPDPQAVWKALAAGDTASIKADPSADALKKADFNRGIFDRWQMPETPYIVYRGHDGAVKIVAGEPDSPAQIINDLATAAH